jgi:hypothetical protein
MALTVIILHSSFLRFWVYSLNSFFFLFDLIALSSPLF